MAALLVVGVWTAAGSLVLALLRRRHDVVQPQDAHPIATTLLVVAGVMLLLLGVVALKLTTRFYRSL